MQKIIGIDISKLTFDVVVIENEKPRHQVLKNELIGFAQLLECFGKDAFYVMEASGPYYLKLAMYLHAQGAKVSVVNPLRIKRFAQMRMYRAKTDKKDAQLIAEYGRYTDLENWVAPKKDILKIQQVLTAKDGLQRQLRIVDNQRQAFRASGIEDEQVLKSQNSIINHLKRHFKKLELRLDTLLNTHCGETVERLMTIPGIGKKSAALLAAITHDFSRFQNHRQLIAYVGFSPRIYQSGTSVNGKAHICKMGKAQVRKILYMCTWSAKYHNKACVEMHERLKQKGKPERVIKIALANKLLKQAFAIATQKTTYSENFVPSKLAF